ncbi:MAG: acetolactate synthase small subunit [Candidatus Omnitrophica bacterium]|nr:acetolactate synthase small subunit [Candidatus Omnitrophota bacterium]MCM8794172.1 acetolactate synthase small subunit [Candidatus Omnitrophota bacterium]
MKHTISVLVENKPGVLARISGLFSARGFNIDSLAVGETEDPTVSRMTIVVDAKDERILEQIIKQLRKLIDTISVVDLTKREFIHRELALIKVNFKKEDKQRLLSLAHKYKAEVLETEENSAIVEICADSDRVKEFLEQLKNFGIRELMRTGRVAMAK